MSHTCAFCASSRVRVQYPDLLHKVDVSFGPFSLIVCLDCGSLSTTNPPSPERLAEFYGRYEAFRPEWYKAGAQAGALAAQYRFYAEYLRKYLPVSSKSWVDVGAGHGEVAGLLSGAVPAAGTAVEIGLRPAAFPPLVEYRQVDLNKPGWLDMLGRQYDFVYSVAVWEHVLSPLKFAAESLSLVAPGGTLLMITPNFGSLASRVLGQRWPYFEPGEHLSIPTPRGAELCVRQAAESANVMDTTITIRPISVGYSLRYAMQVARLNRFAELIPPTWSAPLPTGILTALVRRAQPPTR